MAPMGRWKAHGLYRADRETGLTATLRTTCQYCARADLRPLWWKTRGVRPNAGPGVEANDEVVAPPFLRTVAILRQPR